jgi:multidrug efflux pump subunit AcrB
MSAIPFGIVGAVLGHFLLGQDFTFISLFGIVALMGVVVNDSVVLMDFLNRKVDEGESVFNAAILAIKRRFRPILLTSLTTSLGLFPMLLETSLQARFLIPMVISLAAGIIFATVIILLLVPSLVLIAEDIKSFFSKKFGKYFN